MRLGNVGLLLGLIISGQVATCQTQKQVLITIGASPTQGISTYHVYRGSAPGGPYPVLVCTLEPSANPIRCSDPNVSAGQTYYYVATATNSGGESAYSPEAKAVIPAPPSPPSSLAVTIVSK